MSDKLYRIVFNGELAYGFEVGETRANLKRLCKYDDPALDKLFSGQTFTIKSKLARDVALKYKSALDKTGIVCSVEEIQQKVKESTPEKPKTIECPKCQQQQPHGMTCMNCVIVFAKYAQAQERKAAIERGEILPDDSSGESKLPPDASMLDRLSAYFTEHQEQAFIVKAFLVIGSIIFVTNYLSGLLALLVLFFPVLFLIYVRGISETMFSCSDNNYTFRLPTRAYLQRNRYTNYIPPQGFE